MADVNEIPDVDVTADIWPTEDFVSDETNKPPTLTVDATRVLPLGADEVSTATHALPSYVDNNATALQIVPRRGNNQRKSVRIRVATNAIALFGEPVEGAVPVTVGGVAFFTGSYILPVDTEFVYESVAPLYALSLAATGESSHVSVLTESFYPNR